MAYTKNRKKNGIGREYRGRKLKGHNKDVQAYVDATVAEFIDITSAEHDRRMRAKWDAEGRASVKKGNGHNKKDSVVKLDRENIMIMPDKRFDHPDLHKRSGKYSPADKIAALTAYMVTGNTDKASIHCGVPGSTIVGWKRNSEWWPALMDEVRKEKTDEMEAMLTGILHGSLEEVVDRLKDGDTYYDTKTGKTYKMPVKAKELGMLTGVLFDKRALIRGDPTRRVENVSTEQRLGKLAKQFESFSKATEISGSAEIVEEE